MAQKSIVMPQLLRTFIVRDDFDDAFVHEAHYQAIGPQGQLELFRVAANVPFAIATYANGAWATVEASMPTEAQIADLQAYYDAQLHRLQGERAAFIAMEQGEMGRC